MVPKRQMSKRICIQIKVSIYSTASNLLILKSKQAFFEVLR